MDYYRCSFLWPQASLQDVAAIVPTMSAALREHNESVVARDAVCDAVLLHDRLLLEAAGLLPPRDLSASANASALVSAYVGNQRNFEQAEERLLACPTPKGMACSLQLLSDEAAHACLAVVPHAQPVAQQDDADPMLSLVLGDGKPFPRIGDDLSTREHANLMAGLPDMAWRLSRLAHWWQACGPEGTALPENLDVLLPPLSDIEPLRMKVPKLMTLLEAHVREVSTRPASSLRTSPRL